jgi:hypothetical protein
MSLSTELNVRVKLIRSIAEAALAAAGAGHRELVGTVVLDMKTVFTSISEVSTRHYSRHTSRCRIDPQYMCKMLTQQSSIWGKIKLIARSSTIQAELMAFRDDVSRMPMLWEC